MTHGLESLLSEYDLITEEDWENALKEIVQHLALLGLWRSKFYEHAAFYGGTALRIFHGLRRFSEDTDFSLIRKNPDFNLQLHLTAIRSELEAFGFSFEIEKKQKKTVSPIESAFIKGNTVKNLLIIRATPEITGRFPKNKKIKIKFELDTDPPGKAVYEVRTVLKPVPFQVKIFSPPDLFAGKLHAVLCREWKTRVKGRDYYDMIWYLGKKTPCHLDHLKERMVQTGHIQPDHVLDRDGLLSLLYSRFEMTDFHIAKEDVRPFIRDQQELDLWDRDFFFEIIKDIDIC
ncbi:nucleotidyl transferase AbiEii/AbiGii toxin family protein [Desulfococcaceae bacterium HSG8]|nr:nucleotidyl transferase AbiEii/AbiGii toxin family protein [Desulfococcaceae bacterium HSG8]